MAAAVPGTAPPWEQIHTSPGSWRAATEPSNDRPPNLVVKTSRRQFAFSCWQCQPWDFGVPPQESSNAPAPCQNSLPGHLGGIFLPRGMALAPYNEGIVLPGLVSKTQQLYSSDATNASPEAPSIENDMRGGRFDGA